MKKVKPAKPGSKRAMMLIRDDYVDRLEERISELSDALHKAEVERDDAVEFAGPQRAEIIARYEAAIGDFNSLNAEMAMLRYERDAAQQQASMMVFERDIARQEVRALQARIDMLEGAVSLARVCDCDCHWDEAQIIEPDTAWDTFGGKDVCWYCLSGCRHWQPYDPSGHVPSELERMVQSIYTPVVLKSLWPMLP